MSATVWCQSGQLVESSTSGMSAFHSGSLTSSNRVHSCLWREFAFASNGRWSGLLHEIYDIGERDVVRFAVTCRRPSRGASASCRAECRGPHDSEPRHATDLRCSVVRFAFSPIGRLIAKSGAIHLQHYPRPWAIEAKYSGLHRVCQCLQVGLVAAILGIASKKIGDECPARLRLANAVCRLRFSTSLLQVSDVLADGFGIAHRDRAVARRQLHLL